MRLPNVLMINTNYLHRFRETSTGPKSLYFATPLAFNTLPGRKGSLGTISLKFSVEVSVKVPNGVETLPKLSNG